MTSPSPSRKVSQPLLAALLAMIVLAVYWPAATFEFLQWDDQIYLLKNPLMHPPTWAHIAFYWHHTFYFLYAPITYTLWTLCAMAARVQGSDGGLHFNPYVFHSVNIILHCLAAFLMWRLLYRLVGDIRAAWMGAALFALHPLCVEPVAWVSGFRDLLGAGFGLAALWAYTSARCGETEGAGPTSVRDSGAGTPRLNCDGGIYWYAISTLLFLLAILSKPTEVAFLLMALVLDLLWFGRPFKTIAARLAPWGVAAFVLVFETRRIVTYPPAIDVPPWWQRPLIAGDAISFYLGKLLLPIHLGIEYNHAPHQALARHMAIGATLLAVGAMAVIYLLGRRWRWVWLAGALFLAGIFPMLGLSPFGFQEFSTTADRYVYPAMLGPAVAAAFILARGQRRFLYYAAFACVAVFGVLSFQQVQTWRNTQTLFAHLVEINPDNRRAMLKIQWDEQQEGIRLYRQANQEQP